MGRGEAVDRLARVPAEQAVERRAQAAGVKLVEAALARQEREEPLAEGGEQGVVGQVGDGRIVGAGEGGAGAQRGGAVGPREDGEAMFGDGVDQRGLDRVGGGRRVGGGG